MQSGDLEYYMYPYTFFEERDLSATVPSNNTFANNLSVNGGFSKFLFHTTAKNWNDLANGMLFYRFENKNERRYQIGDTITVWTMSSLSNGQNRMIPDFTLDEAFGLIITATIAITSVTLL